jgi:hypothetical protein
VSDSPSAGRRVIFVQPSSLVRNELVPELVRLEYEACWVRLADAVSAVGRYPGSLVFVDGDEVSEKDYVALVGAFRRGGDVQLGILTSTPDPAALLRYQTLRPSFGVVRLSARHGENLAAVRKVLDEHEARGRRRYLRVVCDDHALVNFSHPGQDIRGQILDISSVGMACLFRPDREWKTGSALSSLQLQLKGTLCLVDGVVLGSRLAEHTKERVYVILFDPKTAPVQRDKIRAYIQKIIQTDLQSANTRSAAVV